MSDHEKAVRDAAVALRDAIVAAEAAGFRVDLPAKSNEVDKVAISDTSKRPSGHSLTTPAVSTLSAPVVAEEPKPRTRPSL